MTSEEIKNSISMMEVVRMYGINVDRKGFCKCPFHSEKTGSMKIYKDSFHCFGCNESGDIFSFVQKIEGCSFKDAFLKLGGTYKKQTTQGKRLSRERFEHKKKEEERKNKAEKDLKKLVSDTIRILKENQDRFEPFSDGWCYCQEKHQYLIYIWDEKYINEKEVNEVNVIRICREVGCRIDSFRRVNQ